MAFLSSGFKLTCLSLESVTACLQLAILNLQRVIVLSQFLEALVKLDVLWYVIFEEFIDDSLPLFCLRCLH